jgi:hypothetical protein
MKAIRLQGYCNTMRSVRPVMVLLVLALFVGDATSDEVTKICGKDGRIAVPATDELKTWEAVHKAFQRFSPCDSGSVGENFSDAIALMLAGQWSQTRRLQQLTQRDREFETFVIRHLNELMTAQQAVTIEQNAEKHCPDGAQALCEHILKRIRETPCPPCADILKRRGETPWPESTPTTTR